MSQWFLGLKTEAPRTARNESVRPSHHARHDSSRIWGARISDDTAQQFNSRHPGMIFCQANAPAGWNDSCLPKSSPPIKRKPNISSWATKYCLFALGEIFFTNSFIKCPQEDNKWQAHRKRIRMASSSARTALRFARFEATKFYGFSAVYMVTMAKIGRLRTGFWVFYIRKLDFFVSALFVRNSRAICAFRTNAREDARDVLRVEKTQLVRN